MVAWGCVLAAPGDCPKIEKHPEEMRESYSKTLLDHRTLVYSAPVQDEGGPAFRPFAIEDVIL
jgi:hypothetical protein